MAALGCCGLFIAQSNKPVPLTSVAYDVEVKGFASSITVHQTYKNVETTDLECVYGFPMNDQAAATGFTVKIGDRVLTSQFKKKDEAFKEYNDALKEGHGAYLLDQSDRSDDTFVLSVGRLPPGQECTVSISYACLLDSLTETKQRLVIPTALSPRYNPEPGKAQGSVAPPENYRSSVPYTATLKGRIETIDAVKTVSSPSHPISVTIESSNVVTIAFGADQQPLDKDLVIDVEVKSNPQHAVMVEKLPNGQYVGMYSFVPHFEKEDSVVKSELIFVVDCSGSMQSDDRIKDAKRAMGIFLRSIPEGCYFNIYRFGSTFESLFPKSELYSADAFAKAKDYAQQTDANLGGTEILQPLEKIFSSETKPGIPRQLFVLTDGEVTNTDAVIALVRSNAHNSRVFSFGIGDSPSRTLVNGIAGAGNGKFEYAKKGEVLEDKVGRHLSRALQPSVTDAAVLWEGFRHVQQVPSILPPAFRGDRQIAFAFFEKEEGMVGSVVLQVQNKVHHTPVRLTNAMTSEKSFLEKLAARALIKELEIGIRPAKAGSLQNRASKGSDSSGEVEKEITKISLLHGVMSKYVSLVAVEKLEAGDKKGASPMELREIPILRNEPGGFFQAKMAKRGAPQMMACFAMAPMAKSRTALTAAGSRGGGRGLGTGGAMRHRKALRDEDEESEAMDVADANVAMNSFGYAHNSNLVIAAVDEDEAPLLNKVLDLQKWDGSWEFSKELEGYLGVSRDAASRAAVQEADGDLLATLVVIAFLKAKFAAESNIWGAMVTKARTYVGKTIPEEKQDKLISSLESLF